MRSFWWDSRKQTKQNHVSNINGKWQSCKSVTEWPISLLRDGIENILTQKRCEFESDETPWMSGSWVHNSTRPPRPCCCPLTSCQPPRRPLPARKTNTAKHMRFDMTFDFRLKSGSFSWVCGAKTVSFHLFLRFGAEFAEQWSSISTDAFDCGF